jgi:hypothetical protein
MKIIQTKKNVKERKEKKSQGKCEATLPSYD